MTLPAVTVTAVALATLVSRGTVSAEALTTLLQGVTDTAQRAVPSRAEGTVEIDGLAGKQQDRIVWIERPGAGGKPSQVYVELANAKARLLALAPDEIHVAVDGKAKKASPQDAFAGTSFTAEDFLGFSSERCAASRVADLGDETFTLVCEPKKPPSQYALMVYKFDREKSVLRQALLYKDSQSNLVKMVKHEDLVAVGGSWRPKRIVMQDFKLRTKDVLALDWKGDAKIPAEAFAAKSFAAAKLGSPKP